MPDASTESPNGEELSGSTSFFNSTAFGRFRARTLVTFGPSGTFLTGSSVNSPESGS